MDYSIFWTGIQNFISEQDVPSMFLTQLQYYSFSEGDKSLTLVTPNDFLKDFILSNYKKTFENILLKCWNQKININIIVDSGCDAVQIEKKEQPKQKEIIEEKIVIPPKTQLVEEPQKIEPIIDIKAEEILPVEEEQTDRVFSDNDEECTFDSFLTDDTNEYAFRLAQTIAEEPGNPKRNPLFLWGESGTGKTHLIKAIKQRAERLFNQKKITYVTSENFLNEFLKFSKVLK